MGEEKLEQRLAHISHNDLDGNINALSVLAGGSITNEQWREILVDEEVANDGILLDALYDHLLEHGDEIQTVDALRTLVQKLKE